MFRDMKWYSVHTFIYYLQRYESLSTFDKYNEKKEEKARQSRAHTFT